MEFSGYDVDYKFLSERAIKEAEEIYSKNTTRRNRGLIEIIKTTIYGHIPEVYLIEKCGFTDDIRKYKDVIDINGNVVEVKVTEGEYYVPYVIDRANKAYKEKWRNYPEILYVFIGNKKTLEYKLHGIYQIVNEKFVLQSNTILV